MAFQADDTAWIQQTIENYYRLKCKKARHQFDQRVTHVMVAFVIVNAVYLLTASFLINVVTVSAKTLNDALFLLNMIVWIGGGLWAIVGYMSRVKRKGARRRAQEVLQAQLNPIQQTLLCQLVHALKHHQCDRIASLHNSITTDPALAALRFIGEVYRADDYLQTLQ